MRVRWRHRWNVTPAEARRIQERGREQAVFETPFDVREFLRRGRIVALDVSYDRELDHCFAALVHWDLAEGRSILEATHGAPSTFPYEPGLLSFREIPPLRPLLNKLELKELDVLLCDGQGFAHPRRFGLATHLGVLYDRPSIGWAKSRLIGTHREPGLTRSAATPLMDEEEQIGWVLRSRTRCRPTFVSPGHRISMKDALAIARGLLGERRLCEPARRAHQLTTIARRLELERRSAAQPLR